MAIRVGRIPYLDAEPFYFDMARRGIELIDMAPNVLVQAIEVGEVHAGPVPLADSFRLDDRVEPIAGFCLSSTGLARNLSLYSRVPIEELDGASVVVSDEASAYLRLLQVLLGQRYGVSPGPTVTMQEEHQAILLTGNQALRLRRGARGYPNRYDLGQEWKQWTNLPLVYARWVVRRDLDPKEAALLEDTLYVGLEDGVDSLYHLADPREDLLMLPRDIVEYVQGLKYYIGMTEQRSIDRYRQCLDQMDV
jgi:chorismate dehydratase